MSELTFLRENPWFGAALGALAWFAGQSCLVGAGREAGWQGCLSPTALGKGALEEGTFQAQGRG